MMLFERNNSYEEMNDFSLLESEECYSETHRSVPSFICGNSVNKVPDVNDMLETYPKVVPQSSKVVIQSPKVAVCYP